MARETLPAGRPWQARLPFYYGWVILAITFCMGFFGLGLSFAAGLLVSPMQDDLGWSRAAVLGAVTVRGLMGIVLAPLVGHYADTKLGAYLLPTLGGLVSSAGLVLVSGTTAEWQFLLLFGVLGGLAGVTQGFVVSAAILPRWFIHLRGMTGAIATMGGASSAIGMPILVPFLVETYGWRGAWLGLGTLAFLFTALPALLLRRQPEDVGLLPDGVQALEVDRPAEAPRTRARSLSIQEATRTSGFWILVAGMSLGMLSQNALPTNMPLLLADRGFAPEAAALGLTGYGIASVGVKLILGTLATRFPIRNVLIVVALYAAMAAPVVFFSNPTLAWHGFSYALLIGSSIGGFVAIQSTVWAEYYGRSHLGAITGIGRPFGIVASWGGVFLMALSADLLGSYDASLIVSSLTWLLCAAALVAVRPPRRDARPT